MRDIECNSSFSLGIIYHKLLKRAKDLLYADPSRGERKIESSIYDDNTIAFIVTVFLSLACSHSLPLFETVFMSLNI